ncbi:hypothetical protein [Andreprevotia sp. IGB-42]|uniref:hypothetical protein n=1 Tax=Andreprevotia sp. IGB-42 TaxID=2497473 RepID=UPI00191DB4EE|nr:hypothetical protein [Andreprevotia sp. IGB-42]
MADLHEKLFETLDGLKSGTMDIERAKAISDIAQTIINGAKVEVDYIKQTGAAKGSGFLDPATAGSGQLPDGSVGRTVHKLR